MIQIRREGNTIMLQLDHGDQIYATIAWYAGELILAIGDANSIEEFVSGCQGKGLEPIQTANVIELLEQALDTTPNSDILN